MFQPTPKSLCSNILRLTPLESNVYGEVPNPTPTNQTTYPRAIPLGEGGYPPPLHPGADDHHRGPPDARVAARIQ